MYNIKLIKIKIDEKNLNCQTVKNNKCGFVTK